MKTFFVKTIGNKYHLCTTELRVGDTAMEVTDEGIQKVFEVTNAFQDNSVKMLDGEYGKVKAESCLKIVGEVSSYAVTYVEEGNQISIADIFPLHRHDPETDKILYVNEDDEIVDTPIYLIKGPCGHYH